MKSIIKLSSVFLSLALLFSCQKEELDIAALTDFPPSILSTSPGDGSKVVVGNFDLIVKFVDGTTSPLESGSVVLRDDAGNELYEIEEALSGTADSIFIAGTEFNAADLEVGFYGMTVTVSDTRGQTATEELEFEISTLPFAANYDEMYLAGSFNGWGADQLELVGPHTWEIKEVMLDGGEWKLKNCADWCDQDWGDPECDGIVENTTGGGANSACSPSGLYNMRFNDETLTYSFSPAVVFESNVSNLYLLGSFNSFEGDEYAFTITEDHTWVLNEVLLAPGDEFKFAEYPSFMGRNWGDNEGDGVAEEFGSNIVFASPDGEAFYNITFDDRTLEYTFEFAKFPSIGIIGSATPGGWDTDTDMTDNGDGTFSLSLELTDGEAKFRANDSWDTNWGGSDFPSGVATENGPNIPVTAGNYNVTFNPSTGEYNFEADAGITTVGIIGSATPGGWDADTDMRDNGDGTYTLIIGLVDGEAKFRANDNWDVNWGGADFPSGNATAGGPNIPVTAGLYTVTFDTNTGDYSFTPASIGIIGSATPGGWDTDTDMTVDPANPAMLSLTIDLADGEAKFRANDEWVFDWGAADFPSGTGTQGGPNIPVSAGTYTVSFNVNTGEYRFE